MLLMTGTGRSGTSLLAKYCLVMNNDPGGRWNDEADAGFEDDDAVAFTHAFHKGGRKPALLVAQMQPVNRSVVKVPQVVTLFQPALVDCWLEVKPDLRLLIAKRPFAAVGQSFARKPDIFKMGTDPDAIAAKVQKQYEDFMAYVVGKGIPHRIIPMLTDEMTFAAIHDGLTAFGGLNLTFDSQAAAKIGLTITDPTPEGVWNVVYDPDKKHF